MPITIKLMISISAILGQVALIVGCLNYGHSIGQVAKEKELMTRLYEVCMSENKLEIQFQEQRFLCIERKSL